MSKDQQDLNLNSTLDLKKLRKAELIIILNGMNLSTLGHKTDLINRIMESKNDSNEVEDNSNTESNTEKGQDEKSNISEVDNLKMEVHYLKTIISELREKLDLKQMVINLLQEKENSRPTNDSLDKNKLTYATMAKNDPGILIKNRKENENCTPAQIIKDLQNSIKQNEVSITKMKSTKTGIILQCENENEISALRNNIDNSLSDRYISVPLKKYRPRIIVNGIKYIDDLENNDLRERIIKENNLKEAEEGFYLQIVTKMYNKKFEDTSFVIEVDANTYKFLKEEGKGRLKLAWNTANIKDHIHVRRCTKCWSFNHNELRCTKDKICGRCCEVYNENHKCETNNV